MPAANPDPMRRLGDDKPVVTIQTKMNNNLNLAVPVRTQAVYTANHLQPPRAPRTSTIAYNNLADSLTASQACDHDHGYATAGERHAARPLAERAGRPRADGWAAGAPGGA